MLFDINDCEKRLSDAEKQRLRRHLKTPVCETLRGVKRHLDVISFDEIRFLCGALMCSVDELIDVMWAKTNRRNRRKAKAV